MRDSKITVLYDYKHPDNIKLPGELTIQLTGNKPVHNYRDTIPVNMLFRVLIEPKVYIDNVKRISKSNNYDLDSMESMIHKIADYTSFVWNANIGRYNLGYDNLYDDFMLLDTELSKVREEKYKKLWEEY